MRTRDALQENANAVTHGILAVVSFFLLFLLDHRHDPFFLASFITFYASYGYHSSSEFVIKEMRRQLDIAAIYLLVAASVFESIPQVFGITFFIIAFLTSIPVILGIAQDFYSDFTIIFLSCVAVIMVCIFCVGNVLNLLIGVSFYFAGLWFYFQSEKKWMHTIWHLFVCAGWLVHVSDKL